MKLLVGLGNPGPKHAGNRHNAGFMAADAIAAAGGFGPWRQRFHGDYAEGQLGNEKVILLKPATFMNNSGQSVGEALRFYKIAPSDVIVMHDELDLEPGKCRLKTGGGHAGHNGLRSVHQHIGESYRRLRIGIGHPGNKDLVSPYVLHDFAKADQAWLAPLLERIGAAAGALVSGDDSRFMNALAPQPARGSATRAETAPAVVAGTEAETETRSPLQRLLDRFR